VISDAFWRRHFAADPSVLGQILRLSNGSWQIIGVMPAGFTYPLGRVQVDLWVPYVMSRTEIARGPVNRGNLYVRVIARLRPEVSVDLARARMEQLMADLGREQPAWFAKVAVVVRPLKDAVVGTTVKSWLLMLLAAVGCVFAIVLVNVTNLFLTRATTRQREISVRVALGATRWQIARALLVESLLVALSGAALGVALAYWMVDLIKWSLPPGLPRAEMIAVDVRVLAAAVGAAVGAGVVFALAPTFAGSRMNLMDPLRDGGRVGSSFHGRRLRAGLVVAEVSLAVVLLVGAGLFMRSFARFMRVDVGLEYRGVVSVGVYPPIDTSSPERRLADSARAASALTEIAAAVRTLPGVDAVSAFDGGLPLADVQYVQRIIVPGRPKGDQDGIDIRRITPEYLDTMGLPLRRGRHFTEADNAVTSAPVVLLNDVAAARYLGDRDPLGAVVDIEGARTVVGIVGNTRSGGPETPPEPEAYIPLAQGGIRSAYLMIRTEADSLSLRSDVTSIVARVAPDARIGDFQLLTDIFDVLVAQRRFNMVLLGLFGLLAIAIASVGVYGVLTHLVQQQTQEIGIRLALGAEPRVVLGMILKGSMTLVGGGIAIGISTAWALSRVAAAFLFEIGPRDPVVLASVVALVAVIGLAASIMPARRAARVDPLTSLRAG
jgi:putative ABC transport system permease protein